MHINKQKCLYFSMAGGTHSHFPFLKNEGRMPRAWRWVLGVAVVVTIALLIFEKARF